MGECISICENKKEEEEENQEDKNSSNGIRESIPRTKKNKTRIPKNVIIKDDEEEDILPIQEKFCDEEKNKTKENKKQEFQKNAYINDKNKTEKARDNWNYLIDKLIAKRIDILREVVKKEKEEDSDEIEADTTSGATE